MIRVIVEVRDLYSSDEEIEVSEFFEHFQKVGKELLALEDFDYVRISNEHADVIFAEVGLLDGRPWAVSTYPKYSDDVVSYSIFKTFEDAWRVTMGVGIKKGEE